MVNQRVHFTLDKMKSELRRRITKAASERDLTIFSDVLSMRIIYVINTLFCNNHVYIYNWMWK